MKHLRVQIDSCLQIISKLDFPQNFSQLFKYFINNIDGLKSILTSEEQLFSPVTKNFMHTLKLILKEQAKRKCGSGNEKLFYDYSYNLLIRFKDTWDYLNTNFKTVVSAATKGNLDRIIQYIQLARYGDNIISSTLIGGYTEMYTK